MSQNMRLKFMNEVYEVTMQFGTMLFNKEDSAQTIQCFKLTLGV